MPTLWGQTIAQSALRWISDMSSFKHTTLLFLVKDDQILLAMKKRGFGAGKWNGVGGKIEPGESIEQAAIRECQEEIGVTPNALERVANLTFTFDGETSDIWTHTFIARGWTGEPVETEEMAPRWFAQTDIPYADMWEDDAHWLPHVLEGKKVVATFLFNNDDVMQDDGHSINLVEELA